jgi:hypothetical protein
MKTLMWMMILTLLAGSAMAGGDKVRGDNGQGSVNQVQVQDPPPFQDPDLPDWELLLDLTE